MKFLSKDETFFDQFRQLAVHIGRSAELLSELLQSPGDAARLAAEIRQVRQDGDAVVHVINQRIDTSFVTPLDREDMHRLAKRLDKVIDLIDGAARRVVMFRITESRPGATQMADILVRASREIAQSVGDVTGRVDMLEHARSLRALEQEGDALYAECVGALFAHDLPAIDVIKWKDIFDALEHAVDACEDVSDLLESIAVKNG